MKKNVTIAIAIAIMITAAAPLTALANETESSTETVGSATESPATESPATESTTETVTEQASGEIQIEVDETQEDITIEEIIEEEASAQTEEQAAVHTEEVKEITAVSAPAPAPAPEAPVTTYNAIYLSGLVIVEGSYDRIEATVTNVRTGETQEGAMRDLNGKFLGGHLTSGSLSGQNGFYKIEVRVYGTSGDMKVINGVSIGSCSNASGYTSISFRAM